jgi:hypothetical protein
MLIADAQIRLWNAGNPTTPRHRQIPAYIKAAALREMDAGGVDAAVGIRRRGARRASAPTKASVQRRPAPGRRAQPPRGSRCRVAVRMITEFYGRRA